MSSSQIACLAMLSNKSIGKKALAPKLERHFVLEQ